MAKPFDAASLGMNGSPTTRRAALAALAAPLAARSAVNTDDIAEVITLAAEKNAAFMRGDMERWSKLVRIAPDFTLMQPFGGPASHGFDASPQRLAEMSRYFRGGKTELEVAQTYSSGDLVVLVMIERQHGRIADLPDRDLSMRVTSVHRRTASGWELVHRHADPLVRTLSMEKLSSLADE